MANLKVELNELLDNYSKEVQKIVDEETKAVANEAVKKLRTVTFKTNKKGYSKGWATKKDKGTIIVYNRDMPGLTHLLENGHVVKNQYGQYGRAAAQKHIEPIEQESNEELVRRVESRL